MDTEHLIKLQQLESEIEREFEQLLKKLLVGLPAREGTALAEKMLAKYNALKIEMAMKAARFLGVVH